MVVPEEALSGVNTTLFLLRDDFVRLLLAVNTCRAYNTPKFVNNLHIWHFMEWEHH